MYSRVPLHKVRYVTLERCGAPRRIPQRTQRLTFFSKPNPRRIWPFLMASFSSTPEMASSTTTSQAPRRRSPGLFTIFTKRSPWHQAPSQLGGHPPRVTSSRSLTRTNRGGELNTMQECKARTPKVFKSFSLKSHQSNKC